MNNTTNKYNQLSLKERQFIENELNKGTSTFSISKALNRHHTTVYREIKRNKFFRGSNNFNRYKTNCLYSKDCGSSECNSSKQCFNSNSCELLDKSPYVCNPCTKKKYCRKNRYHYYAINASTNSFNRLSESRSGFDLDDSQIKCINDRIAPLLINKGQSINHIFINNRDVLSFSKVSFYKYIKSGILLIKDMDLNRKVKLKPRYNSKKRKTTLEKQVFKTRKYDDFLEFTNNNPDFNIVEMDTVVGLKEESKTILTLMWRKANFMLMFLLENNTSKEVSRVFTEIKNKLGIEVYSNLFRVILTDRGSEFLNAYDIELNEETGEKIVNVFYCDPNASYQKGTLEKNHEFIRYFLPKGSSFEKLTQLDCINMMNNINSTCREYLNNKCPHDALTFITEPTSFKCFDIVKIPPNDVILNKSIFKNK